MPSEPKTTREDVVKFLEKHMVHHTIELMMAFRVSAFGMMSADEFAAKTSWNAVLGVFKRIYE